METAKDCAQWWRGSPPLCRAARGMCMVCMGNVAGLLLSPRLYFLGLFETAPAWLGIDAMPCASSLPRGKEA